MGFFEKISAGLKKTRDSLMGRLEHLAAGFTKVDEDFFDELEETLIMGDVGANVTMNIMDQLRDRVRHAGITDPSEVLGQLREIITGLMGGGESAGSLHQAVGGAGDRRQRCGQDHHHRQDGCLSPGGGQAGAAGSC